MHIDVWKKKISNTVINDIKLICIPLILNYTYPSSSKYTNSVDYFDKFEEYEYILQIIKNCYKESKIKVMQLVL